MVQVLTPEAVATIRSGCARVVQEMAGPSGDQRARYRWSFGAGRRPWGLVEPEWAVLIDPPPLLAVLTAIYGADDFLCCGCGGDFVLPGAVEYQNLHSDMGTGEVNSFATTTVHTFHHQAVPVCDSPRTAARTQSLN